MHIIKLLKSLCDLSSTISPVERPHDEYRGIFKYIPPGSFAIIDHTIEVKELSFKEFSKLNKVYK